MTKMFLLAMAMISSLFLPCLAQEGHQDMGSHCFRLTPDGYFQQGGVDVMAFSDFYPEGHQGGVSVIMNGQRIATNIPAAKE